MVALSTPILFAGCLDCMEQGGVPLLGGAAICMEEVRLVPFESGTGSE